MPTIEKVSIALTTDLLAMVRKAVDTGDYASTSEVIRDALRQWRAARGQGIEHRPPGPAISESGFKVADRFIDSAGALLKAHGADVAQLCRRYGVRHLGVFGSALRADFDPARSDIDLVVEFTDVPGQSPARQYFDFKTALEQQLARPVDLVEISAMPDSRLRRSIERTQVPLYVEAA